MNKKLVVKQDGYKECGAACLLSIIRYYGHARHLQRVLEGEEDAAFSALVDRQGGDVLAVKYDAAARHGVDRIAGDGVAERGFSRAVRPHENVRLVAPDREVNAVKDLLFPHADVQAIDL